MVVALNYKQRDYSKVLLEIISSSLPLGQVIARKGYINSIYTGGESHPSSRVFVSVSVLGFCQLLGRYLSLPR